MFRAQAEHEGLLQHATAIGAGNGGASGLSEDRADQATGRKLKLVAQILGPFETLHQEEGLDLRDGIDAVLEQKPQPDDARAADDVVGPPEKGRGDALRPRAAHRPAGIGAQDRRSDRAWTYG
jgi:hypothetical protein